MDKFYLNNIHSGVVNIIIVNYNCYNYTIACLSSLLKSSYKKFKIYIVDNLSTDNSLKELETWITANGIMNKTISYNSLEINTLVKQNKSLITLIKSDKNIGFGAGNNIIIKPLSIVRPNDYVWLLNPDTEVESEVLNDLVNLSKNKIKLIAGNVIYYYKNRNKIMYCGGFKVYKHFHGMKDIKDEKDINKIDAIAGTSLFTHMSTYLDLGVLPEEYFMYWEETDFCTRAKLNNYSFSVNLKSKVFDHVGASSKNNFLREYLYLLNGLKYHKKYNPFYMPLIIISTLVKLLKAIIFEDKIKRNALFYAHIDFFKTLTNNKVNIKKRLLNT